MKQKTASLFCLLALLLLVQVGSCRQETKLANVALSTVLSPVYYEDDYQRIQQELLEKMCQQFRWLHQRLTREAISAVQTKNQRLLWVKDNQKEMNNLAGLLFRMYIQLYDDVDEYAEQLRSEKIKIVKKQLETSIKICKKKGIEFCEDRLKSLSRYLKKEVKRTIEVYEKAAKNLIDQEDNIQSLNCKYSGRLVAKSKQFEVGQDQCVSQEYIEVNIDQFYEDYSDYYNYVKDHYLQYGWRTLTRKLVVSLLSKGTQCSSDSKSNGRSFGQ